MRLPLYDWEDLRMLGVPGRKKPQIVGTMPTLEDVVGPDAFYTTAPDASNSPDIEEGDRILCDPSQPPKPGDYVAAVVDAYPHTILARYRVVKTKNGKPTAVDLVPNRADIYETFEVRKMSDLRILGTITHRTHRLRPVADRPLKK